MKLTTFTYLLPTKIFASLLREKKAIVVPDFKQLLRLKFFVVNQKTLSSSAK